MATTRVWRMGAFLSMVMCSCTSRERTGSGEEMHSFEDKTLPALHASDGIKVFPTGNITLHVYDVSTWPELWGGFAKDKTYHTLIALFLIQEDYSVISPALFPPRGYNDDHRAFDAPRSTTDYKKEDWPDIVGVVEANTKIRIARILMYGTPKVQESFQLLVEAEIIEGQWKGTHVDVNSPGFDTFEEIPNASFQLADVGRIETDLLVSSPDPQFLQVD